MAIGKLPDTDLEGGEEQIFSEINITPLTDIFLVLLIIFIVSGSVAVEKIEQIKEERRAEQSSGLKINLPSGEAQEIDPGRKSLVVAIGKDGAVQVNDQEVAEGDLERLFMSAFVTDKNTQVVLRADSGVSHGRVVGVMEQARRVGLSRLAIATKGGS